MGLVDLARDFLSASGYHVDSKERNLLVASRPGLGGDREYRCVWVLTTEERHGKQQAFLEEEYLGRFRGIQRSEKYHGATLYLLTNTFEGLSTNFLSQTRRAIGVKVHVPAQFFDTNFKHELVSRATASAILDLAKAARDDSKRVPQAYTQENGNGGNDLLQHLLREIDASQGSQEATVWFVVAPAGYGKSVLFSSLFSKLYDQFQDHKKRQRLYPRPMPMLPAHIREAAGNNVDGLIDAFLRTEIAMPTTRDLFSWLVDNRHALWMLDGLDEVITRDERFFTYLEDRITTPRSRPAILVCVRDSLLETSAELSDFLHDYHAVVKTYKLSPWDLDAKRRFAWIQLEGRTPKQAERDGTDVSVFLASIRSRPTLDQLSATPFYADLLLEEFRAGGSADSVNDEIELLNVALRRMCEREYEKGSLSEDVLPLDSLVVWLEELAALSYEDRGVSVQELEELAALLPVLVTQELGESDTKTLTAQIEMLPFFRPSPVTRKIEFTHELIAELLAARRFLEELRAGDLRFAARVSLRQWPADSVFFRVLAVSDVLPALKKIYREESLRPVARRNLSQLIVRSHDRATPFRDSGVLFEGVGLEGVIFESLDLDNVSFRSCDLTNTVFRGCSLQNALFEGAVLKNTGFAGGTESQLTGCSFGSGEHFESVTVDEKQRLTDDAAFRRWVAKVTGTGTVAGPCATKQQLHHLFRKFVHVNGQARRDELDRRGLERGKQYAGAPDSRECVDGILRSGYLEEEARFGRIRRPQGPKYGEIVNFVRGTEVSAGLTTLLRSLCLKPGCRHE